MSRLNHTSEVMHQLVLNNPNDPYAQILRHCPFFQAEMLKRGYMSTGDLAEAELNRLSACELDGFDIEEIRRKETEDD